MDCYYHQGTAAVGVCQGCGNAICGQCRMEMQGKVYCRSCVSRGIGLGKQTGEGPGTMAIVAFVLSIVGVSNCATAIPGMILGIVELRKINRGESPEKGRGFALAAVIVGAVLTGLLVLAVFFYLLVVLFIIGTEA